MSVFRIGRYALLHRPDQRGPPGSQTHARPKRRHVFGIGHAWLGYVLLLFLPVQFEDASALAATIHAWRSGGACSRTGRFFVAVLQAASRNGEAPETVERIPW